jgi:hypothetical protein
MSPELPDALLLVDPKAWVKHHTKFDAREKARINPARYAEMLEVPPKDFDRSQIQVFRKPDLEKDDVAAVEAEHHVLLLSIALSIDFEPNESTRKTLLSAPAIQQAFLARCLGSKKAAPPRRRPKKPSAKQRRDRAMARGS